MKKYKYIGIFKSVEGHTYELQVYCNGFLEAVFLLTAKAIESGRHYQLYSITDEETGSHRLIDNIMKCEHIILEGTGSNPVLTTDSHLLL